MRTWLHKIATNTCLTALQSKQRRPLPSGLGGDAFDHGLLAVEEMLRRLAQIDGARQRAVIALVAAGDLEELAWLETNP